MSFMKNPLMNPFAKATAFCVLTCLFVSPLFAENRETTTVSVRAGKHALHEVPYAVEWTGNQLRGENMQVNLTSDGERIPAQVEVAEDGRTLLWFLATVPAGETRDYTVVLDAPEAETHFSWVPEDDDTSLLTFDGNPVLEYIHPRFDPDNIEETKKPFHQVFAPNGQRRLTKGLGGRFPHHRGIYFGYNRINFEGGSADIWHASRGERSEHRDTLRTWAGPVFGGHEVRIDWIDSEGTHFIEETRTLRVFKQSTGDYLIDFTSTLKSRVGEIELGGDNHHAGVQFRAAQFVADHSETSRFLRPGDWAELDPAREHAGLTGMPWNAFQFVIEGDSYTVAYLTHPANADLAPVEQREMSERLYGRFGEFIPTTLSAENPRTFRYRFWVTDRRDDLERDEINAHHSAFADGFPH